MFQALQLICRGPEVQKETNDIIHVIPCDNTIPSSHKLSPTIHDHFPSHYRVYTCRLTFFLLFTLQLHICLWFCNG